MKKLILIISLLLIPSISNAQKNIADSDTVNVPIRIISIFKPGSNITRTRCIFDQSIFINGTIDPIRGFTSCDVPIFVLGNGNHQVVVRNTNNSLTGQTDSAPMIFTVYVDSSFLPPVIGDQCEPSPSGTHGMKVIDKDCITWTINPDDGTIKKDGATYGGIGWEVAYVNEHLYFLNGLWWELNNDTWLGTWSSVLPGLIN